MNFHPQLFDSQKPLILEPLVGHSGLTDHGPGKITDFPYTFCFHLSQGRGDRGYGRKLPESHQSQNQWVIPIIVNLPQATETEQKMNNHQHDNQMAFENGETDHQGGDAMTATNNYRIDFIKRTKEILEGNFQSFREKDREVTFLLNCLLGLIVTISENEKRRNKVFKGNSDTGFLTVIPEKIGFVENDQADTDLTNTELTELNVKVGHKNDLKRKSKLWLINKLRNGIAHQNIEGVNENDKWVGVRLWNTNNESKKDFEIIFMIEELKSLAIALSDKYLEVENA